MLLSSLMHVKPTLNFLLLRSVLLFPFSFLCLSPPPPFMSICLNVLLTPLMQVNPTLTTLGSASFSCVIRHCRLLCLSLLAPSADIVFFLSLLLFVSFRCWQSEGTWTGPSALILLLASSLPLYFFLPACPISLLSCCACVLISCSWWWCCCSFRWSQSDGTWAGPCSFPKWKMYVVLCKVNGKYRIPLFCERRWSLTSRPFPKWKMSIVVSFLSLSLCLMTPSFLLSWPFVDSSCCCVGPVLVTEVIIFLCFIFFFLDLAFLLFVFCLPLFEPIGLSPLPLPLPLVTVCCWLGPVLVATDVAARGLDIPNVWSIRTMIGWFEDKDNERRRGSKQISVIIFRRFVSIFPLFLCFSSLSLLLVDGWFDLAGWWWWWLDDFEGFQERKRGEAKMNSSFIIDLS